MERKEKMKGKNKKRLIITAVITLVAITVTAAAVYAASYDSASDPLVALSYLTDVFRPSVDKDIKAVSDKVASAETRLAKLESSIGSGGFDPSELEGRLDSAENSISEMQGDFSEIQDEIAGIKSDLKAASEALAGLDGKAASKSEVEALEAKLNEQISRLDSIDSIYRSLLDELISEREEDSYLYGYETVTLSKGERLVLSSAGDMMLKSGRGSYFFSGSAYDVTGKKELTNGAVAENGHIVAFDDTAYFDAVFNSAVMVRGEWKIER